MSEYAEARRNPGRPAAEVTHRSPQHAQAETPFAPRGPAPARQDALAESLNRSARVQSLLQAKQMLHDSPRMASQRALQRALNPDVDRVAIQREVLPDEEEVAQAQYGPVQRQAASAAGQPEEEDEILQGRFEPAQPVPDSEPAQPSQPNRTGLSDNLKTAVETLSGFSLSDVRVHYNSPQPAQLHALAYAQGADIHVGPGQERHLPHEAWHVVQQKQGRVKPTLQMKGVAINDDAGLEREADAMRGARAATRGPPVYVAEANLVHGGSRRPSSSASMQCAGVIQRWTQAQGGGKLSEKHNLLLRTEQELYASDNKFEEANAIAGGEVKFKPNSSQTIKNSKLLTKVVPTVKPDTQLAKDTKNFDQGENEKEIRAQVCDRVLVAAAKKQEIEKRIGKLGSMDEQTKAKEAEEIKKKAYLEDFLDAPGDMDEATKKRYYDTSPIIENMEAYFALHSDESKPLIPSDCMKAAATIAGFNPEQGVPTEIAAAGTVYRYIPPTIKQPETDEEEALQPEWMHHFAAIIMTDGEDHVTMENAGARESDKFGKLQFDRTWYFEMYGPKEDQRFADKYGKDFREEKGSMPPDDRLHLRAPKK